jgi:hypothetical protein
VPDMDDAEFERQKTRVKRYVAKWHGLVGLEDWRVRYDYDRTGDAMPTGHVRDGYAVLAHTDVNWPFRRARITFNVAAVADITEDEDDDLEEQVVHEMCHVLLDELAEGDTRKDAHDHLERSTTTLARAFITAGRQTAEGS